MGEQLSRLASPLRVMEIDSIVGAAASIAALVRDESIEQIVIGLPLNMDGTLGPSAREVIDFAGQVGQRAGLPVIFVDERLSSFAADEAIASRRAAGQKLTRRDKVRRHDAYAAAHVLQAFLDGRLSALDMSELADR